MCLDVRDSTQLFVDCAAASNNYRPNAQDAVAAAAANASDDADNVSPSSVILPY